MIPRKLNWSFIFSALILIIFLIPLFRNGLYVTHDGQANIARFAAYFKAFSDAQIPPRWAGDLNFGYGTPIFIFYYPLTGYLASSLHLLTFSYENTFKILMGFSLVLSFVTFYLFSSKLFKKEVAVLVSLLYAFAPYHLLNLYVRGDVAELLALSLVPLVFFYMENIFEKNKITNILLGAISYGILIISHNGVALIFTPVIFLYAIVRAKNRKQIIACFIMFAIGFFLSAFFWIPAIAESKYVNAKLFIADTYKNNFLNLRQIIYSPWGFGSDVNKAGGLAPQVGIVYSVLAAAAIVIAKKNKTLLFWIFVFLVSIFITTPLASYIWSRAQLLKFLEFPWRFISLSSFSAIILAGYILNNLKNRKLVFVIFLLAFLSSAIFINTQKYEALPDSFYESYPYTTYFHGEASPIWAAGDAGSFPKSAYKILEGNPTRIDFVKQRTMQSFYSESPNDFRIVDNTFYFPGWRATIDGVKTPIEFQDIENRGLISFRVPKGKHNVLIKFSESPIRLYSDIITLGSILIVVFALVFRKRLSKLFA